MAFRGVSVKQTGCALFTQHGNQLPSEIETVLHRDIHAETRLWAVRVAGVTRDKHARQALGDLLLRHVVELVGQALSYLVNGPPRDLFHLKSVRMENAPRFGNYIFGCNLAI